jgi:secreted trypsin-like serine protease
MRRPALAAALLLSLVAPTIAMVGGAPEISDAKTQPEVMLVGSRGNFCTGTAIARDLVLTAAHCIAPDTTYKLVELDAERRATLKDVTAIARHPQFNLKTMLAHRATADVALLKLAAPLSVTPATLAPPLPRVIPGEKFLVRGYGAAVRGDGNSAGTLRSSTLIATGQPGNLQLRLVDEAGGGTRAGLGACTGDSGAPVYQQNAGVLELYGVVSWSTGPNFDTGCGGVTGVTPLELYRGWIEQQAKRMGSAIGR